MKTPAKILLVDDDSEVRSLFSRALTNCGYRVVECGDGADAISLVRAEAPALIVLDVEMPKMDGWKTLSELRRLGLKQPVLMITHVSDVDSRVRGLDGGADDYLAKPCVPAELLARVSALLRRAPAPSAAGQVLRFGEMLVDLEKKTASSGGNAVRFTRTEFALLDIFLRNAGKPVSRELLLEWLWGSSTGHSHTIDTHLWRLRKKLGDTGDEPRFIKNLPGIGYVMHSDSAQ